jgi:hypothetical protein
MEQNDWTRWFDFRNNLGNTIDHTEYLMVMELHAKYFNHKYKDANQKKILQELANQS